MLLLSWLAGVPLPVAAAVFDMGKRGHKKKRIAVLFMVFVISAYLCKFLIPEGLVCLMCWRNSLFVFVCLRSLFH